MKRKNHLEERRFSFECEFTCRENTNVIQEKLNQDFLDSGGNPLYKCHIDVGSVKEIKPTRHNILKGKEGRAKAWKLVEWCKRNLTNLRETQSTGFHVHHDVLQKFDNPFTPKHIANIFVMYHNFRDVIDLVVPNSRRGSQVNLHTVNYQTVKKIQQTAKQLGGESYNNPNMTGYFLQRVADQISHCVNLGCKTEDYNYQEDNIAEINPTSVGTVEFRKQIFTVDEEKFMSWIDFTQSFMAYCQRRKTFAKLVDNPAQYLNAHKCSVIMSSDWINSDKEFTYISPKYGTKKKVDAKTYGILKCFEIKDEFLWAYRNAISYPCKDKNLKRSIQKLIRNRNKHHSLPERYQLIYYLLDDVIESEVKYYNTNVFE